MIDPDIVEVITNPVGDAMVWYFALGLSVGVMISLWIVRRCHHRCRFCGNLHPERPRSMNALVFMMTICRRAEEIQLSKEMRWQHQ